MMSHSTQQVRRDESSAAELYAATCCVVDRTVSCVGKLTVEVRFGVWGLGFGVWFGVWGLGWGDWDWGRFYLWVVIFKIFE